MPKFREKTVSTTLTEREVEYLKTVFRLLSGREAVGSLEVAEAMGVSCATASEALKKLYDKGMLERSPWKGVSLSEVGIREVDRVIRNHRVFETYAYRFLSIRLEDACDYARRVELHLPEEIIDSMCSIMGHPEKCPHNERIPRGEGCCLRRQQP
ncbi:metal-dependent transcriptional regulator [Candidatus Bathyarchaeota archaeon]|nr:metal-dependent transcriptional regulator [Candidatus Bathyarchaeota archaeon]